jgi:hypothetical protein
MEPRIDAVFPVAFDDVADSDLLALFDSGPGVRVAMLGTDPAERRVAGLLRRLSDVVLVERDAAADSPPREDAAVEEWRMRRGLAKHPEFESVESGNVRAVIESVVGRGHSRVLCECGQAVYAALAGSIDELVFALHPGAGIEGGPDAEPEGMTLADALRHDETLLLRFVRA